ncbi:hypothetical protein DFH08DRAFT_931088 [Mycena albidolilacea]|uniref:Uncharacterized protein n=1 Tax=Mycena albidolilacea TaxID=1033008 RepID=A0AAD7F1X7_9AGAR|nr:hypothetical protein DFH08DRAFT_931088 [Mycena albidolilacea]
MPILPLYPPHLGLGDLPVAQVDTCDNINDCRTFFNIIGSCLSTILLCTWVSLHPNVPPPAPKPHDLPEQRVFTWTAFELLRKGVIYIARAIPWREIRMMVIALIAPELILAFAVRQYVVARRFSKEYPGVSRTHGFFFAMGGFVTREGHHPIVKKAQLAQYIEGIRKIREKDIIDKSKGDTLSKVWAFVQVLWFAERYFTRLRKHLPTAGLETVTLGFAVIYGCTWWFWRKKPQDVAEAIQIDPVFPTPALGPEIQVENESLDEDWDVGTLVDWPRVEPLDDSLAKEQRPTVEFLHRHLALVGQRFNAIVFGKYWNFDPMSPTSDSVPSLWAIPVGEEPDNLPFVIAFQIISASLFGGVHCGAWSARFPSTVEMWMWRASAALITVLPPVFCVLLWAINRFKRGNVRRKVFCYLTYELVLFYVIARVVLLILSFTTLRNPPPRTFVDAGWTAIF